ncbi:SLAP domain-containing protein [Lactobacillus apis]|uniref:SLAP domain-containing protein n=1 Tax=Lactobacillus apis TaxID=303541 RepID=UPI0016505785|nr:SLAP domain-containing protein [Lactobacillus apis]MBC6361458.1 hypothetical protein [Lactobacillus apis]
MSKNNFYKKMIISVTGATLLSVGLSQVPSNEIGTVPTEVSAATKTKVIGANSAVYKKTGKKTKKVIKAGKKIHVYGQKTINGKLYYKIGKNEYIKASNVDGKKLKAAKNTVLYTRSGKVIKNSKVRKGQGIKVYGSVVTINGKKYYSTKYGYIKVSALAKKEKPVQPNNNTQNSTGNNSGSNGSAGSNGSTSNGSGSNGSTSNGSGSNGSASNGSGSNGSTSNGSGSNSSTSNGSGSNGSTSNGSGSNGSTSNGSGSNGSTSNGSGSNGSTSNGSGSNGSTSNGSGSNGATPNGSAEPQK